MTNGIVKYDANAKIGTSLTLKKLLDQQKLSIDDMLPAHITPERMIKTMLVAVNKNPALLDCTQASIMDTFSRAAELGLDLSGTLGEAYPVPFNAKQGNNWVKKAQLIIGYRGFVKLVRQSNELKRIDVDVVYENDDFDFCKGLKPELYFRPKLTGNRGNIIGAYALIDTKDGGYYFDFMTFDEIEKVRRTSKSGSDDKGNAKGIWKSWWGEMAKKTVLRRVTKLAPLSTDRLQTAIETDNEDYRLDQQPITVEAIHPGQSTQAQNLSEKLHAKVEDKPKPKKKTTVKTTNPAEAEINKDDMKDDNVTYRTGEPAGLTPWEQLIDQLAGKCGAQHADAATRLLDFIGKVLKATPDTLTDTQITDLHSKIESGEIAIK